MTSRPTLRSFLEVTRPSSAVGHLKLALGRGLVRASRRVTEPASTERRQPPDGSPAWSDSFYFMGGGPTLAWWARLGFRPHLTETWLCVWTPETGLLDLRTESAEASPALSAGGLSLECLEPLKAWRLRFDGVLHDANGAPRKVQLDGRFTAQGPLYDFDAHSPAVSVARSLAAEPWSRDFFRELSALHQTHVEQVGETALTLSIDGVEQRATVRGVRDHSFGLRRWTDLRGHCWITCALDDGTAINVTAVRMPRLTHVLRGYVLKNGRCVPVVDAPTLDALWAWGRPPTDYSLSIVTEEGERLELRVRRDAERQYRLGDDGALAFHEGIAHFTVGSATGRGISEFSFPLHP